MFVLVRLDLVVYHNVQGEIASLWWGGAKGQTGLAKPMDFDRIKSPSDYKQTRLHAFMWSVGS